MSLEESNYFSDLFLNENDNYFLNFSTISGNLNDILSESSPQEPQKKNNIRFILTKEEQPQITFLNKKINLSEESTKEKNINGGRWNKDEQFRFAEAVLKSANDWKQIQNHVFSRNMTQVRSHAQKFLMKLKETKFMLKQNIDLNLSWTKIMKFLKRNVEYNELKQLLFSVEQSEEKNEKPKLKKNKSKKKINNKTNNSFGETFSSLFDNYEKEIGSIKIKEEEEEENEALEKFIECFNNSSEYNLNSSFDEISSQNQEEIYDIPC